MRKLATETATKPAKAATVAKAPKARKQAAKPAPKAATPKPETNAAQAARAERAERLAANREHVARYYAGASLTAHKSKAASLDTYAARVTNPVQRIAAGNGPSERDHSLLALIHANAKAGVFDPVALACDAGVISRLASIGFIAYDPKAAVFSLTAAGTERAKLVTSKAVKAA